MSTRGEIVVACDTKDCHAEYAYNAAALWHDGVRESLKDDGWRERAGKDICPDCVKEGK